MHLEVLVEDASGKKALDVLIPKIVPTHVTYKVHSYRGVGRLPKDLSHKANPQHRILLAQLPKLLQGYGAAFAQYPADYKAAVIIVCDLDDQSQGKLTLQLKKLVSSCSSPPPTRLCLAIEEGEAWFLGDSNAIRKAYPKAKQKTIDAYEQDSICGTWEVLADAVYPGGRATLKQQPWTVIGFEKSRWAEDISPHMDVEQNSSPSFRHFRDTLRELCA